ncbi:MAG: imidazolonepropionase [Candidatus Eisenbacteria bacterium]|uniref:Imidazolonepropionase n=1 Tax=Eiseniibacteriota bacterium TaxID=2212470 RepID=A0A956SE28_UNCEI|nr:imidazolonepropionase [Candidatus Eisenbacteria bacterium]
MKEAVDLLVHNAGQVVTMGDEAGPRRGSAQSNLGLIANGAVAVKDGRIVAVGPDADIRSAFEAPAEQTVDADKGVVLPGFTDPHTHLLFAGTREHEFEMRCQGKTYMEIAAEGGGIRSSVRSFRTASDEAIVGQSLRRLDRMLSYGTTTVEVKSGYALSTEQELRALRLIDELDASHPCDLVPTFLGAHEFPDEHRADPEAYVRILTDEMLPRVAEETRARFCDVFCEKGVFDLEQTRRVVTKAQSLGLRLKLHADEFEPIGGAELAGELHATSADHLLASTDHGLEALRAGGVIAVCLPGTSFSLGKHVYARGRKMIEMGIPVALASDCNPGSSMVDSMPLVLALACLEIGLTPAEAVVGATVNSAYAVGEGDDRGRIAPGLRADLQILDAPSYVSLVYHLGGSHVRWVVKDGRLLDPTPPRRPSFRA